MASISIFNESLTKHLGAKELIVIEIGSRGGESLEFLMDNFSIKKIISIDPFELYHEFDDYVGPMHNKDTDELFNNLKNKFKDKPVEFFRKKSDEVHAEIENLSVDLVFVDGNHTYEFVYNDIKNYLPKIKQGGIMCGDDYFMKKATSKLDNGDLDGYPDKMVYEAVNDFFEHNNEPFETIGPVWCANITKGWLFHKTNNKTVYN